MGPQNTTFGGLQGFTRKPATPWTDDTGKFAGIVHQERGWTYVLFDATGHLVPMGQPAAVSQPRHRAYPDDSFILICQCAQAFTFLREFILGRNQTGLVTETSSGTVSVYGGEDPTLARGDFYPGQPDIYYGAGSTQYTRTWPSETVTAWNSYIFGTLTQAAPTAGSRTSGSRRGKDVGISARSIVVWLSVCLLL
jgi:carboxypeptidase D